MARPSTRGWICLCDAQMGIADDGAVSATTSVAAGKESRGPASVLSIFKLHGWIMSCLWGVGDCGTASEETEQRRGGVSVEEPPYRGVGRSPGDWGSCPAREEGYLSGFAANR